TGNPLGRTAANFAAHQHIRPLQGIAFSGDGSKLAYTVLAPDPGFGGTSHDRLFVVNGTTGAAVSACTLNDSDGALAWWGNDLIVSVALGAKKANVYNPTNGQILARLTTDGEFRLDGRDGQLWAFFGRANRGKNDGTPNYVCSYAAPQHVKAGGGKTFRVTPDGIE
ncbi:MAG TPA: hypothetical protein VMZ71_05375, partial [Gemmataceae bacterium]|nr:hypothetical protein [Gemmataceae bacterium]